MRSGGTTRILAMDVGCLVSMSLPRWTIRSFRIPSLLSLWVIRLWCTFIPQHRQIDPNRTISAGRVDIGAFRTYPENYTPAHVSQSEYQSIPLNKIEDFGVHANQYYQLDVEIFKSTLDNDLLAMLWNKYWVNTLSQSPLVSVCWSNSFGRTGVAYGIIRIGRMQFHSSQIFIRS